MSAPACDDVPETGCAECAEDQHAYCLLGECECLCREGWVKERFGWRLPVPSERAARR